MHDVPEPENLPSESVRVFDHSARHPRMAALTQQFSDAELEKRYVLFSAHEALPVTRLGLRMGIALFALFGVLDLWVAPAEFKTLWLIRLLECGVFLGAYLLLQKSRLVEFHQHLMAAVALLAGLGLLAMILIIPDSAANQYYVGLILLIMATYSVFGLRFLPALLVTVTVGTAYLLLVTCIRPIEQTALFNNMLFLCSAVVIGAVGMYGFERQSRIALSRQELLDFERRESLHKALHDPLCGLANRRLLIARIEQAITRLKRFGGMIGVAFIDLDDFKPLNDQFGHRFGDLVLQALSARLATWTRKTDTLARIGGDEFVILLEDIKSREQVAMLVDRLAELFEQPLEVEGRSCTLGASIGVAIHPGDADDAHDLLERADQAMYHAKRHTENHRAFYHDLDEEARHREDHGYQPDHC